MKVAFGHSNMDLDCLGSLVLIQRLFPGIRLVRSNLIHPSAAHLNDLYAPLFDWLSPVDLDGEDIESIVIADTCVAERVQEYFNHIRGAGHTVRIFDHHILENCNIMGAQLEGWKAGSCTTILARMAQKQNLPLQAEEATIALTGIYADTGMLLFDNVTEDDFLASAWLKGQGAELSLVKSFMEAPLDDEQSDVTNRVLPLIQSQEIQGHIVMSSCLELEQNVKGLAAVVESVMNLKKADAYFAFFYLTKPSLKTMLIARSRQPRIDLHELLEAYGGGGHSMAASATIRGKGGPELRDEIFSHLERRLRPAMRAEDIMTRAVSTLDSDTSLMDAALFLERLELNGVPVMEGGRVVGFISLGDIQKGRRNNALKAPVSAYMSKPAVTASSRATLREIERLFFRHHIGRLPIVDGENLLGIVTRWDYLEQIKRQ
jgi:tRNA nucleotidyltransferase (CCA-adding enzyme)